MAKLTIEVTNEELEQLTSTISNLKTQDNSHTRDPVFIVYQKRPMAINEVFSPDIEGETWEVYKPRDNWDEAWYTEEELIEYLKEEDSYNEEEFEIYDYESATVGHMRIFVGCFFTREAAQQHIDSNYYHYNEPFIYVESFWRNPEMETIRNILLKINTVNFNINL